MQQMLHARVFTQDNVRDHFFFFFPFFFFFFPFSFNQDEGHTTPLLARVKNSAIIRAMELGSGLEGQVTVRHIVADSSKVRVSVKVGPESPLKHLLMCAFHLPEFSTCAASESSQVPSIQICDKLQDQLGSFVGDFGL